MCVGGDGNTHRESGGPRTSGAREVGGLRSVEMDDEAGGIGEGGFTRFGKVMLGNLEVSYFSFGSFKYFREYETQLCEPN